MTTISTDPFAGRSDEYRRGYEDGLAAFQTELQEAQQRGLISNRHGTDLPHHIIWWLNQSDAERIGYLIELDYVKSWPQYLKDQFESMSGRAGRGRLWVAVELDSDATPPPDNAQFSKDNPVCRMAADCGGIAVRSADIRHILRLPGFVTTFNMSLL